ncbi:MAG: ethanolamine ammonia lyase-activating protein [Dehalococcoidia bacterium]|nr:ethanolamine ammonia lyase-activating protein [Dehalococcoidia bacterium]
MTQEAQMTPSQRLLTDTSIKRVDAYQEWMNRQRIPILTGHHIDDLNKVSLAQWDWTGGSGALVDLVGSERTTGAFVAEIPAGKSWNPLRHLFEIDYYILSGRGATTVWQGDGPKISFEWQAGSLFSVPLNAGYQMHNGQGDAPVRLVAVSTMPLLMMYFRNEEFLFSNPFEFRDRFDGQSAFFADEGQLIGKRSLETNFIPDARNLKLEFWAERGGGGSSTSFEISGNTFGSHVSDFKPGDYKKGHRHGGGAHIVILAGEGYSLMWPDDDPAVRVDWQPGAFFSPPDVWWHQHFNYSDNPARYLAFRWGSQKYRMPRLFQPDERLGAGRSQIEYEEEDPKIRQLFNEERVKWQALQAK